MTSSKRGAGTSRFSPQFVFLSLLVLVYYTLYSTGVSVEIIIGVDVRSKNGSR